jgi:hypothetical protein
VGGFQCHLQDDGQERQQPGELHWELVEQFQLLIAMVDSEAGEARDEAGEGLIGTLVGFIMFMLLLLLAVQTLVHLYATSAVTAAANDAAEQVASAGGSASEVPAAQREAVARLGTFGGRHAKFEWDEIGGQQVTLTVTARSPALLPLPASYRDIERTVTVRTERFRE